MYKINFTTIIAPALIILSLSSPTVMKAQNNVKDKKENKKETIVENKEEKKTNDIYKEFDEHSFANASPSRIVDSSKLSGHLIGVKYGYSLSNIYFNRQINHKGITVPVEFGLYYTYYHSLWKSMPYFGIQVGLKYSESGYKLVNNGIMPDKEAPSTSYAEVEERYKVIELPLISQFRMEFWKMRAMLNLGFYSAYKFSSDVSGGFPKKSNRAECGIIGGAGVAFIMKPVELHIEGNYQYAFSLFYKPDVFDAENWIYSHANRFTISMGLFFRLNKKRTK